MNIHIKLCWSSISSHGFAWFSLLGFTCSSPLPLLLRHKASHLPFTLVWSIAVESCLTFIDLPCKTTLYSTSSISPHCWFVHQIKVLISHFFMLQSSHLMIEVMIYVFFIIAWKPWANYIIFISHFFMLTIKSFDASSHDSCLLNNCMTTMSQWYYILAFTTITWHQICILLDDFFT
jgi:hypothetical protein